MVHALPAQRLERIVNIRQRHPSPTVQIRQQRLVRKVHVDRIRLHVCDNLRIQLCRRIDHLQAAVHEAERADGRVGAHGLRRLRVAVLRCERAVLGDPVARVVRLLEWVADAGVAGCKDALAGTDGASLGQRGRVEGQRHKLVHVLEDQHVRVELDNARVLGQRKGHELAPAVVEARVIGVVLARRGQQVRNALRGDAAGLERRKTLLGECVGVERN